MEMRANKHLGTVLSLGDSSTYLRQYFCDVIGMLGNRRNKPFSKPSVFIHSLNPFPDGITFHAVLLSFFAFDFERQYFAIEKADEKIRAIFMLSAIEDVANLKNQMIVLNPRGDVVITIKGKRGMLFPAAITNAKVDV